MKVLHFYAEKLFTVSNPPNKRRECTVSFDKKPVDAFNQGYNCLASDIRAMGLQKYARYPTIKVGSILIRFILILLCAAEPKFLLLGTVQFVLAPLSLVSCIMRFLTNVSEFATHFIINFAIGYLFQDLSPELEINSHFIVTFLAVDFVANTIIYALESKKAANLLGHIVWGTFNTKTYQIVVFLCVYGLRINLLSWFFTGLLTMYADPIKAWVEDVLGIPSFAYRFYVEHRLNHLPVLYGHAHKMHHDPNDTTPFDAHIYGNGMNEEYFWICGEVLPCLFFPFLFPMCLNVEMLRWSWLNKFGHTRIATLWTLGWDCCDSNFHADHHANKQNKNFGSDSGNLVLLDFIFGTAATGAKGEFVHKGWIFEKEETESEIKVTMKKVSMQAQ
jgi:sterol desaturase/sphingolipid hydroxylase (fatty acid hydroxylase superfamily)